jgi:hypothetical protein
MQQNGNAPFPALNHAPYLLASSGGEDVMLQKTATVLLLLLVLTVTASAALPVVLQPNASAYFAAELADLNAGIDSLQALLADPALGSQTRL